MKKSIVIIFILMSLCVTGITSLQVYYSYTNYKFAEKVFIRDTNEALLEANDSLRLIHHRDVEDKFRLWMADTAFVKISVRWDTKQKTSIFTIKQRKPTDINDQTSMSVEGTFEKTDSITPEIKRRFIEQVVKTVDSGLKRGTVWYFTQAIGDSLSKANATPIAMKVVNGQYRSALGRRNISLPFHLGKKNENLDYCTDKVNIGVDDERWVQACFSDVDAFLLGKLRWVLGGTLLLIIITLACFWYTAKTLLSQHKLNKMKDDFISNMTHEIHTPLSSILVTAEALKKFRHDEEAQQSYIDIILHQGQKLSALTVEILAGAKMKKDGISLEDTIDVNVFIKDIIDNGNYENTEYSGSGQPVSLKVNALHLANAIANLIDNAIKYNTAAEPFVSVACKVSNKDVVISVTDNGPGIPDSEKERIFGQFYRIPSGNLHNIKGYGLGLSYVRKVVSAHKGVVSVKDNVSSGSIFTIKLPL